MCFTTTLNNCRATLDNVLPLRAWFAAARLGRTAALAVFVGRRRRVRCNPRELATAADASAHPTGEALSRTGRGSLVT